MKSEEELRKGRPTSPPVRWSLFGEEPPEDAGRDASLGSADLFSPTLVPTSPLDSAYETGRKTPSCCPVESDTNTYDETGVVYETARTSRTAKKREKDADASSLRTSLQQQRRDRRQLTFGTSEDSDSEEENRSLTKTHKKRIKSSRGRRSRSSPMKVRLKRKARASSKKRTPRKKRSTEETETEEGSSFESGSSSEDGQVTKTEAAPTVRENEALKKGVDFVWNPGIPSASANSIRSSYENEVEERSV